MKEGERNQQQWQWREEDGAAHGGIVEQQRKGKVADETKKRRGDTCSPFVPISL
jgi:hypothetical protein